MKEIVEAIADVWVVWTNTDLTEGRGRQIPKAVCDTKATAMRIGKKGYVMGSNCPVRPGIAVRVDGQWLVPGIIEQPTPDDVRQQEILDAKQAAIDKAKKAGLTDQEIEMLKR